LPRKTFLLCLRSPHIDSRYLVQAAISERRSFKVVLVSQDSKDALARFQVFCSHLCSSIVTAVLRALSAARV